MLRLESVPPSVVLEGRRQDEANRGMSTRGGMGGEGQGFWGVDRFIRKKGSESVCVRRKLGFVHVDDSLKSADVQVFEKKELVLLLWRGFLQAFHRKQRSVEIVSFRSVAEVRN